MHLTDIELLASAINTHAKTASPLHYRDASGTFHALTRADIAYGEPGSQRPLAFQSNGVSLPLADTEYHDYFFIKVQSAFVHDSTNPQSLPADPH